MSSWVDTDDGWSQCKFSKFVFCPPVYLLKKAWRKAILLLWIELIGDACCCMRSRWANFVHLWWSSRRCMSFWLVPRLDGYFMTFHGLSSLQFAFKSALLSFWDAYREGMDTWEKPSREIEASASHWSQFFCRCLLSPSSGACWPLSQLRCSTTLWYLTWCLWNAACNSFLMAFAPTRHTGAGSFLEWSLG